MCDALDKALSVLECLLDLVHARLNVEAEQLFEPAQHLRLHLGAVSRRHLHHQSHDNSHLTPTDPRDAVPHAR